MTGRIFDFFVVIAIVLSSITPLHVALAESHPKPIKPAIALEKDDIVSIYETDETGSDSDVPIEEESGEGMSLLDRHKLLLSEGAIELTESKSIYGQQYQKANGRKATLISSTPIYYITPAGTYQFIDDTIVPDTTSDNYAFTNAANSFSVHFPHTATASSDILFDSPSAAQIHLYQQSEIWYESPSGIRELLYQSEVSTGNPEGNTIRYNNRYPGVTEEFIVKYEGIKHNYIIEQESPILSDYTNGTIEFQELVTLSEECYLLIDGVIQNNEFITDQDIRVMNTDGELVGIFPAPQVYEGTDRTFNPEVNDEIGLSYRVTYLHETKVEIAVRVPIKWLVQPDRFYPVTIDPSFYCYENHSYDDGFQWGATSFNYTTPYILMGYEIAHGMPWCMAYMLWHDVNIPKDSTIERVELHYKPYDNFSNTCSFLWQFEDADNALPCAYQYPNDRNYVYHYNYWSPYSTSWTAGNWRWVANFALGLQDVIDRPGWSSGNNVGMKWGTYSPLGGVRVIYSYDYNGISSAPYLYVEYTEFAEDDLTIRVSNIPGFDLPIPGGTILVELYDVNWTWIDERSVAFSGGESYKDVSFGIKSHDDYIIVVFQTPNIGIPLEEFWGGNLFTHSGPTTYPFQRHTQVWYSIQPSYNTYPLGRLRPNIIEFHHDSW